MKDVLFKYIEFLLPNQNCIIIPDFGCFIANISSSVINTEDEGIVTPPSYNIVFNQALKVDDGILTSYLQQIENTSYNNASKIIKDTVKEIKQILITNKVIDCGNIGQLHLDANNNIVFIEKKTVVNPIFYGLTPLNLNILNPYSENDNKRSKVSIYGYIGKAGVAAAVISLLFTIPSNKIGTTSNNTRSKPQQASFIESLASSFISKKDTITIKTNAPSPIIKEESNSLRRYYIIIGGDENKNNVSVLLNKIQKNDFPTAQIIESGDRYRIYAASFENKNEAETYLANFRKENPKYETAWLFSKRNK